MQINQEATEALVAHFRIREKMFKFGARQNKMVGLVARVRTQLIQLFPVSPYQTMTRLVFSKNTSSSYFKTSAHRKQVSQRTILATYRSQRQAYFPFIAIQYARSSKFSIYFARRLFIVLSNFNRDIYTKDQAENLFRKNKASQSPSKHDTKAQNQPAPPVSMQSKRVNITDFTRSISAIYGIIYNNDEKERRAEVSNGLRISKNFKLEISSPTLVENSIQVEIIYRLLDETGRGFVRRNDLKIILDNIFHATGAHSNEIVLLFQEIKELAEAYNLHLKTSALQEFNGKQQPSSYQGSDFQKSSCVKSEHAQNIQDMINQAKICPSSRYKKITTSKINQKGLNLDELISLKREVIFLIIEGVFKLARGEEFLKREALLSFTIKDEE
ncbi:hypothetical protein FGO68_gene9251 [Halteria grandinella]|uniref:Uncharacterized protein n=1 Tax=Halteria grandinella TaxID=5974 RepID=A0A8J8NHA6_HALGN|nr:hypothetical protein FGO68_gene9251 [Halteria grandinella]